MILDLNIQYTKITPEVREVFNFKSETCQGKFKEITDHETKLVECLKSELTVDEKAITEIEDELCESNFKNGTLHMKDQLNSASKHDSTSGTRTVWTTYRKLRPRHKPLIPVGKRQTWKYSDQSYGTKTTVP